MRFHLSLFITTVVVKSIQIGVNGINRRAIKKMPS